MENKHTEILVQEFAPNLIKQRPGFGGGYLSYVEGHHYIKRFNEAFDYDWSFSIKHHHVGNDEVYVVVTINVKDVSKEAFGSSLRKGKSVGDALKSASTDALKKAASMFGIGLHLYDSESDAVAPAPIPSVDPHVKEFIDENNLTKNQKEPILKEDFVKSVVAKKEDLLTQIDTISPPQAKRMIALWKSNTYREKIDPEDPKSATREEPYADGKSPEERGLTYDGITNYVEEVTGQRDHTQIPKPCYETICNWICFWGIKSIAQQDSETETETEPDWEEYKNSELIAAKKDQEDIPF